MRDREWIRCLEQLDACSEALSWAKDCTLREAWNACDRPDWLAWVIKRLGYVSEAFVREYKDKGWNRDVMPIIRSAYPHALSQRQMLCDLLRQAHPVPTLVDLRQAVKFHYGRASKKPWVAVNK
jgi:hypothetical protein